MRTRLGLTAAAIGGVAFGFWLGRGGDFAQAAPPTPAGPPTTTDYSQRVVAYIYGTIPITREDLGEYLIARHGADKVELLVNKKIIDHACELRHIEVTEAEIEAALDADLGPLKIKRSEFVSKVLQHYGKTMYEWKEDVIRPRLQMTKLVKDKIAQPTDADLQKAFDAEYGPKVDCRIIIYPPGEDKIAQKAYAVIRSSDEEFDRAARQQANSALAAAGGRIKPIAHNNGIHAEVEKEAFSMRAGEISKLIATPEGTVVIKVDNVIPANSAVKLDAVRDVLTKQVYDKMVNDEIPKMMVALREDAKPAMILKKSQSTKDLEAEVKQEFQQTGATTPGKPR